MKWKCQNPFCLALFEREPTDYPMTCPICSSADVKPWDDPPPPSPDPTDGGPAPGGGAP